jgi:ribosomal protein S18 acetylase RimI-like enzyme
MPLILRRADDADLPAIVKLMNAAFRGTGAVASWNTEAVYISGDRTSESLLRADLAEPGAVLLVASFVEDEATQALSPQGCVLLKPISPETWYLGSLTIDPLLQKSGLGRALLSGAEEYAVEQGARTMQMTVVHVRDSLIAWYKRRGYHLTGETRPFPYGDTRFGVPLREDLAFVVLEKTLA